MTALAHHRGFSARRGLVLGFGGTVVLVGGFAAWSVLASISGAVVASGVVGVENRNQAVEHIDGGTVNEVLVRDGDRVASGDLLLRLDDAHLRLEETILVAQYAELVARRNRLEAEFGGHDAISWDQDLVELAEDDLNVRDTLDGQERLFRARWAARTGEVARLREQIGQAHDEIAGLEHQAASLDNQRVLISDELEAQKSLFDEGLSLLSRVLALERAAQNLEGQSGATMAAIARIRGRIAELEIAILQIDTRRIEDAEELARAVSAQEHEVEERLVSVRRRLQGMEVRAPVAGDVFDMIVFAPQEVVRPGETILQIVPLNARLVVVARINPVDVDQVYPGQPAVLRFSAFPARETPEFDGRLVRVSADAVSDESTGLSWYDVDLSIEAPPDTSGEVEGSDARQLGHLAVTPGMPVEVHIQTAERSVISYLVKPVTDFFHRALRED